MKFNALISGQNIEFEFSDLVGFYSDFEGKRIFFKPSFTARELVIPWLQDGNLPTIIDRKDEGWIKDDPLKNMLRIIK